MNALLIQTISLSAAAQQTTEAEALAAIRFPGYSFETNHVFQTDHATYTRLQPFSAGIQVDRQVVIVQPYNGEMRVMGLLPPVSDLITSLVYTEDCIWILQNDSWEAVQMSTQTDRHGHDRTDVFLNEEGDTISVRSWRSYFGDSTVTARVFRPDPITVAEAEYGGDLVDNNDADDPVLNSLRSLVTVTATFEDDTFFLYDTFIRLKDFAAPVQPVAWSLTPVFDAGRGDPAFEDVNTLYHLQQCRNWLVSLGYEELCSFEIDIDTHGADGADNSFFSSGGTPSIQFGEGGVDDAEDADVIIHEYMHALSHSAAPFSNTGIERRAMDEGYADYLAASYSLQWSSYRWQDVFSWDGHNEFWDGRTTDNDKHYPEDNSLNIYAASGIWSGALADILESIGKENTDKIVLEALYGSYDEMTMPEAALWLLDVEDMLFGGLYHEEVFTILDTRGLLPSTGVQEQQLYNISFYNTNAFADGTGPLLIITDPGKQLLQMFDMSGRMVSSFCGEGPELEWMPPLTSGSYLLTVTGRTTGSTMLIVK